MELSPEQWTNLLFTYGPFGLLVLFIFIVERISYNRLKQNPQALTRCIYGGVWVMIAGLTFFSSYVWYSINLKNNAVIKGTVENLVGVETLTAQDASMFQNTGTFGGHPSIKFRIETPKEIPDGDFIRLSFDRGKVPPTVERQTGHYLTVKPEFYDDEITIRYKDYKLFLHQDGKSTEIKPVNDSNIAPGPEEEPELKKPAGLVQQFANFSLLASPAYAAPLQKEQPFAPTNEVLILQTGVPNIAVRKLARERLADLGGKGIPLIEKILLDRGSNLYQRYEAILSLNGMNTAVSDKLSDEGKKAVAEATGHNDLNTRRAALRYLKDHPTPKVVKWLNEFSEEQARKDGKESVGYKGLAIARFEVLYKIGVRKKDTYGLTSQPDPRMQEAYEAFEDAWKLQPYVDNERRQISPKALWGWGLALNDHWVLNGKSDSGLLTKAKQKFQQMIDAANPKTYAFPEHIKKAQNYIADENPVHLNPIGAQPTVVYYQKLEDDGGVSRILPKLGLPFLLRTSKRNKLPTNAVWFGEGIAFEEVQRIAAKLVKNGIEIRSILPFDKPGKKVNVIELGAFRSYKSNPVYTEKKIMKLTKDQLKR
jgi:hypothetical protein